MGHLLYFRGEGRLLMAGITEYIELVDADELTEEEIEERIAPGFHLHSDIEIDADISNLPCERILVARI